MRLAALALGLALALPASAEPEDAAPTGPSVEERLAEIARRVQAVASYPPLARRRGLAGEALVEFRLTPKGRPESLRTRRSSGHPILDMAAERAVRDAAPLPWVVGPVAVPVLFELSEAD